MYKRQVPGAAGSHSTLHYSLPRHRLSFSLTPDGLLRSNEFRGYRVRPRGGPAAPLALPPGLTNFLVLTPDSDAAPALVLIPDGAIAPPAADGACAIELSTEPDAQCRHHVYRLHRRTHLLSAATVEARLFLAALYAATPTRLPLPGVGRTAGEMALLLLRQSAVNRVLSKREAASLATLTALAAHTPALRLLCAHVATQAQELRFLWDGVESAPDSVSWGGWQERAYRQLCGRLPAGVRNPRQLLTPLETEMILNGRCGSPPAHAAPLDSAPLVELREQTGAELAALQQRAAAVAEELQNRQNEPIDFDAADAGVVAQELFGKMQESLQAAAADGGAGGGEPSAEALRQAREQLYKLSLDVTDALEALQRRLLREVCAAPAGPDAAAAALLRSAALTAPAAAADLVMLPVDTDLLPVSACPLAALEMLPLEALTATFAADRSVFDLQWAAVRRVLPMRWPLSQVCSSQSIPSNKPFPSWVSRRCARVIPSWVVARSEQGLSTDLGAVAESARDRRGGERAAGARAGLAGALHSRGQAAPLPALLPWCSTGRGRRARRPLRVPPDGGFE